MKLFLADISGIKTEYARLLDGERAERVNRYRFSCDKKRCIAAGLLIRHFLGNSMIVKNEYGKPYADNGRFFNISHSGSCVLFALSDCETGCDIERFHYVDAVKSGMIVFTDDEMSFILSSQDRLGSFFKLWTKKESLLKCLGEGFHRSARSVDVLSDAVEDGGRRFYFKSWTFADYTISACSEKNDFPDYIERISVDELLK